MNDANEVVSYSSGGLQPTSTVATTQYAIVSFIGTMLDGSKREYPPTWEGEQQMRRDEGNIWQWKMDAARILPRMIQPLHKTTLAEWLKRRL